MFVAIAPLMVVTEVFVALARIAVTMSKTQGDAGLARRFAGGLRHRPVAGTVRLSDSELDAAGGLEFAIAVIGGNENLPGRQLVNPFAFPGHFSPGKEILARHQTTPQHAAALLVLVALPLRAVVGVGGGLVFLFDGFVEFAYIVDGPC